MCDLKEEGISYFYTTASDNDNEQVDKVDRDSRPIFVGTKRYAGMYCLACEKALGFSSRKITKLNRLMRSADKTDNNIIVKCDDCKATDKKTVVPCCSFDWQVPPHVLRRLHQTSKPQTPSIKKSKSEHSEDDEEEEPLTKKQQTKSYREALTQIQESPKKTITEVPRFERGGHIVSQYGRKYSLEGFWRDIVDPCPVQHVDQVHKQHIC